MKCSYCNSKAIYHRRYSGEYLCRKHFLQSIEEKTRRTIREILRPDIKLGLAVSGGKDSLALSYIIKKITEPYPQTKLVALMVDEGIPGYRDESLKAAIKMLDKWEIEYRIGRLDTIYSFRLIDIVKEENKNMSCTYCGVFRRRILDAMARKEKVDYLFTGHNASDFAQTVLLNITQGNLRHLVYELAPSPGVTPRIYPLKYILEQEVTLYAFLRDIKYHDEPCPYTRYSLRNDIRNFLSELERKRPGITYNIVRIGDKLKRMTGEKIVLKPCSECGFPTTREKCKVCEILHNLGIEGDIFNYKEISDKIT